MRGEKKKVGFGFGECLSQAISFEFCELFWCGDSVMILIDTFSSSFMFRKIGWAKDVAGFVRKKMVLSCLSCDCECCWLSQWNQKEAKFKVIEVHCGPFQICEEISCALSKYLIFRLCMLVLFNEMKGSFGSCSQFLTLLFRNLVKNVVSMYQVFTILPSCWTWGEVLRIIE